MTADPPPFYERNMLPVIAAMRHHSDARSESFAGRFAPASWSPSGVLLAALFATTIPVALGAVTVGSFSGGDPGEGLDLQGNFTYAVNVGPTAPGGPVGDAVFTADNAPGVTVIAENSIAAGGWGTADFGETEGDRNLSFVMNSIRWAPAPSVVTVRLAVETGADYKLQLLFREDCCAGRGFNVVLGGELAVPDFMPAAVQSEGGDFLRRAGFPARSSRMSLLRHPRPTRSSWTVPAPSPLRSTTGTQSSMASPWSGCPR